MEWKLVPIKDSVFPFPAPDSSSLLSVSMKGYVQGIDVWRIHTLPSPGGFFHLASAVLLQLLGFLSFPGTCLVDQTGLELTEIRLSLPPKCWE